MASATLTVTPGDPVAMVTLRNPPVNALAVKLLKDLAGCMREAAADPRVKAVVIAGDKGRFSGGFDITAIRAAQEPQGGGGGGVFDGSALLTQLVEGCDKPVVAAIEGLALGGGLELAMSCHARVAGPKAMLGLPELNLGVIPGFGGTQRLPRLVGLAKACEMMLTSKPIKSEAGAELGLVDALAPKGQVVAEARALALRIAGGQAPRNVSLTRADKIEDPEAAKQVMGFVKAQARKKAPPGVRHPLLCLDAIEAGAVRGPEAGLAREAEVFAECVTSDVSKALVHIFFASRGTAKVKGVTDGSLPASASRPLARVGVVGGGLMGSGIATACVLAGIQVALKEINQQFLDAGVGRVRANLASRVKKGRMSQAAMDACMARLVPTLDYRPFSGVEMVIEAAVERIDLKQKIFQELEAATGPDCILTTNTSTINIDLVSAKIPRARPRVLGAHFFSPAHVMPLLEYVRTDTTSPEALARAMALSKQIKKTPVVVGNCTGFAVNRVFFPYGMATMLLLDAGVDPYAIDAAIGKAGFGMPMGPLRLNDLVGMPVNMHVGKQFVENFSDRAYANGIIPALVEANRMGETTKCGFYTYDDRRKASPDPEGLAPFLAASRAAARLPPAGPLTPQDIVSAIMFPVVNEASRVIAEGVVERAADLDVATVMSMGFPAYRGGIVKWADAVGCQRIVDTLQAWAVRYPGQAGFFKPSPLLVECARSGRKLGDVIPGEPRRAKL